MLQMLAWMTTSGLAGLASDAREFVAAVRFARTEMIWLLLLLPVLGLLNRWAATRRRAAIAHIGRPAALAGQLTHPVQRKRWLGLAYPLAWGALILGLAGPRWGKSDETGVAVGRDIVIVVDLSRSMQAQTWPTHPRPRGGKPQELAHSTCSLESRNAADTERRSWSSRHIRK
jgi:Ca-activated chloride channel family protein